MNATRRVGPGVLALHVDVTEIQGRFVGRNVGGETNHLPAGPQRPEV